jgi:Flp pilus assembly protein TadD
VALDPARVEFRSGLGHVLVEGGRTDEGITHLKAAVAIDPGLAAAWNNLGLAYARQGDLEAAAQSLTTSLALDPDQPYARENLLRLQEMRAHAHR